MALGRGALSEVTDDPEIAASASDVVVLATPVLGILDWMERLAPSLQREVLVTDVGSTKLAISRAAARLFPQEGTGEAREKVEFLGGHPMAGKEHGGAAIADAELFQGAMWLFTSPGKGTLGEEWTAWVTRFGARTLDMDAARHDEICAWVSHVPQMLSTALAAMLEERLREAPELAVDLMQVGGRALQEMTRLGASPFSMWRDIAHTNADAIAGSLQALEQKVAHLRENLKTPELREEFAEANAFGRRRQQ